MLSRIFILCFFSTLFFSSAFASKEIKSESQPKASVVSQKSLKKQNFNQASAKQISKAIHGIGQKRAQAIVAYRDAHGSFKNFEELAKVKGISKRFIINEKHQLDEVFFISDAMPKKAKQ